VLFYEATEGGAGVLTRLVHDPDALARVAHAALRILHLNVPAFGTSMPTLDDLEDVANTQCVAGCYRCLLSYYNQPDHPVIDRRDRLARELLLRLASVTTVVPSASAIPPVDAPGGNTSPQGEREQEAAFDAAAHGLPAPDKVQFDYDGTAVLALWRTHRVALLAGDAQPGPLSDKGLTCISWPTDHQQQGAALASLRQHLG
jgi:hypothetical protein